ncbi:MAG: PilZ domain-containing protein [Acidobacteria bacterium]|nr:PilZ domain-containing protein [Acidobacteriota bacterium]MDA1233741.1 PilZ domain-containing protein [Acidobacteriota bacterium]
MSKINALIESTPAAHSTATDHRRDPRHPTQTVVLIYWLDDGGLPCDSCAVIRDVSARGFGIETDKYFPVGQALTIRTADSSLECVVRHMQEYPNSFMAGLEVLSSSDGSSLESSLSNLSAAVAPWSIEPRKPGSS